MTVVRLALAACVAVAVLVGGIATAARSAGGSVVIVNAARVTYDSGPGASATIISNSVTTTVASVGAIVVTPKEAAANPQASPVAQNAPVTRTFTITNTGNVADAYTITAATVSAGTITAIAFADPNGDIPVTLGTTISPTVAPGGTMQVRVTFTLANVPVGSDVAIDLTARTTAKGTTNGLQSDNGQRWVVTGGVPQIAGPGGSGSQITKTVDAVSSETATPGSTVVFSIAFENYGHAAATGAYVTDQFPVGIRPDPTTVQLNGSAVGGATLTGQTLRVPLGTVAPNVPETVTVSAQVSSSLTIGSTYVNVAAFGANGIAPIGTTPASVFVGTSDEVFDGLGGAKMPVGGAIVTLLDPATGRPLTLASLSAAATVNPTNANPFKTGPDGRYGFAIPVPASRTILKFTIRIDAPNYLERTIGATVTPDVTGTLYRVDLVSQDGEPLAAAGGFTLTTTGVTLDHVFGLLGNLPLFGAHPIAVTKVADRTTVAPGDRVAFTIGFSANTGSDLGAGSLVDTLPPGLAYAPGTAKLDGAPVTPAVAGATMTVALPKLAAGTQHTLTYVCVVLPDARAGTELTNSVQVAAPYAGTNVAAKGGASATVITTAGPFGENGAITGRVYVDRRGIGRFVRGDEGVAGARVVLEDGESVTTDAQGRFSFPAVRPGAHVLRLDPTTLPAGLRLSGAHGYDDERSALRLVHGILDEGLLQDVNFAVEAVPR
jgi:uncharacterized repeat protein (TIGR01451 family)/fimbrial isopeptide formation D2 family protein